MSGRILAISSTLVLLAIPGIAGCAGDDPGGDLDLAPLADMPREVRDAPRAVRDAYRFALANREILQELPCYCGCGGMGHTSNYSCYADRAPDGSVRFEGHALGCSICVDITLDAMRLIESDKALAEIREYVDMEYSRYGPSNMPPPEGSEGAG